LEAPDTHTTILLNLYAVLKLKMVVGVPEDLNTFITRLYAHARKHLEMMDDALKNQEWDTVDFLASIVVNDLVKLRQIVNSYTRFSKQTQG
jgi:hypothetical protein